LSTDQDPDELNERSPEDEAGQGQAGQADGLTDELARKYDPERLLKLVSKRAGRGDPLEASVRARYEKRFGVDLSHVRVYTGEFAEEFNKQRNAYAVTIGSTGMILMGGSPDRSMATAAGQALLGHELTHVAQAERGLYRKAQGHEMTLAHEEHEHEAEAHEADIAHEESGGKGLGGHHQAANAAAARQAAEDQKKQRLEKIKDRVLEMFADAERSHQMRNGVIRRA
jgi:hypothetical protein